MERKPLSEKRKKEILEEYTVNNKGSFGIEDVSKLKPLKDGKVRV
jgi:hypothetical protein